jgi:hypothetical protein
MQEIKIGDMAFDIMFDIENLGNLINDDWGRVDSYTAPSNVPVTNVEGIVGNQFVLTPNTSYTAASSPSASDIVPNVEIAALASVYRIQLGLRFRF